MAGLTHHERFYRGDQTIDRLRTTTVTICGVGALGSNLADSLVRQGVQSLRVIDNDRVEEHNIGTQIYSLSDVGAWKVDVLRGHLFRVAEVDIDARRVELTQQTVRKCLRDSDVVVDAFDNSDSRETVKQFSEQQDIPCLHAGLAADYGEVVWNANYRVPTDAEGDVCDYPLARNIVQLTATIAAEVLIRWVASGEKSDYSVTLQDFSVRTLEPTSV